MEVVTPHALRKKKKERHEDDNQQNSYGSNPTRRSFLRELRI
jgi:hypothetical protein